MACFLFCQTPVNMLTACNLRQRSIDGTGLQRRCLCIAILCHKGSSKLRKCSPMSSLAFVIDIWTGLVMFISSTLNDKCDKAPFTIYNLTCFLLKLTMTDLLSHYNPARLMPYVHISISEHILPFQAHFQSERNLYQKDLSMFTEHVNEVTKTET